MQAKTALNSVNDAIEKGRALNVYELKNIKEAIAEYAVLSGDIENNDPRIEGAVRSA